MIQLATSTMQPLPPEELAVDMNFKGLNGAQDGMPELSYHANIPADDWDHLFHAVEERLQNCVGKQMVKTSRLKLQDPSAQMENTVLECVAALDLLQSALKRERQQRRQLVIANFAALNERNVRNDTKRASTNLTIPASTPMAQPAAHAP